MSFLSRVKVVADTLGYMSKKDLQEKLPGVFKAYSETYGSRKPDIQIVTESTFSFPVEKYTMGSWHVVYAVLNGVVKSVNAEAFFGKSEKLVPGSMFLDCIKGNLNHCYLYVHPQDATPLVEGGDDLSDDECLALAVMSSYKAFARKEEFQRHSQADYNEILTGLADKKLVKINRAGSAMLTMEGKNRAVQAKKTAKEKFQRFYG